MQGSDGLFTLQIAELDGITAIIPDSKLPSQHFILLIKVRDQGKQKVVELRLTNCLNIFFETNLTEEQLVEHKREIKFEGNWTAYINLFKKSLLRKDRGGVEAVTMSDSLAILQITYPIAEHIKMTGRLALKGRVEGDKPKKIQQMMFEVFAKYEEEKARLERKAEEAGKEEHKKPVEDLKAGAVKPSYEEKKRKYKGNLINPNVKKKKQAMGAKIGAED